MLTWKQSVGVSDLTAEQAKELLRTFNYPTRLDKKKRLVIDAGMNRLTLGFKPNGASSTIVGVSKFRLNALGIVLTFIFVLCFFIPAVIFIAVVHRKRKKVYLDAIRCMNQAVLLEGRAAHTPGGQSLSRLGELNELKEHGLVSEEEYRRKRDEIISKM